ncbi:putative F-box protein At5g55150 [Miscanthus floridulus]|uniref:putative F-box protein At5g55150 n=1 Tax=Miscanthus floridulus TaxID=154761 RepID=UPI00345A5A34
MSKKKQRSPPWSDLTPELLALVFLCLPRRSDRVLFTAVCRAWRSAVQQCCLLPSPVPWLVRPDGSATRFPCGSETIHLPDGVRYHNSCGEWLLLSRDDRGCFLMNPFTKATMLLPKLFTYTTYPDPSETIHRLSGLLCINRNYISVLSLVVCSKRLIAVIVTKVLGGRTGTLALCRPGDRAWSMGTNELSGRLSDIVFFRGKLYAIDVNNGRQDLLAIEIVDENGKDDPRVSRIERIFIGVPITSQCSYLVESRGRLLMVRRKINCRHERVYCWGGNSFILVAGSSKFEVFEADFGRMLWTKLRSLGDDQALFVGRGCSRAVCVSPYDLSRDSIFFVDDYISSVWKKTTTSCGVYDMKDKKVYSTLPMVSWMSGDIPATWLFCEESTTNGLQITGKHLQEPVETDKECGD